MVPFDVIESIPQRENFSKKFSSILLSPVLEVNAVFSNKDLPLTSRRQAKATAVDNTVWTSLGLP